MSATHHGATPGEPTDEQKRIMQRFIDQINGEARRQYSAGRIAPDDDGDLSLAVAADPKKKIVAIHFGKSVTWIGLGEKELTAFINLLIQKRREIATAPFTLSV